MVREVAIVGVGWSGFRSITHKNAEMGLAFGWRGIPTTSGAAVVLSR